jgi:peroxiredoxin
MSRTKEPDDAAPAFPRHVGDCRLRGVYRLDRSSALVGRRAPEFALESLGGPQVSLASFSGKTRVLTFWASWCGPCRMELPMLADFYQRTHQPGSGFEIFAISMDTAPDAARKAAESLKLPFPVLLDPDGRLAGAYQVEAIPMLLVIDREGIITYSYTGFQAGMDVLLAQQLGFRNYSPVTGDLRR